MAHAPTAGNAAGEPKYYVPHGTTWPIMGSIGLFTLFIGVSILLNGGSGTVVALLGAAVVIAMMFLWFGEVIRESEGRYYNGQVDKSFRMGMMWFILSEVMFFACFFGALYYAREFSLPWLGGAGTTDLVTNGLLWPSFEDAWPSNGPAAVGGNYETMGPWGVPALNTAILLLSGVTITIAHHGLKAGHRNQLIVWLLATVLLGFTFLGFQAWEYIHAYTELNLKLSTGIYGSTFFMLTGFHGLHVTIGAIMLAVIWFRCVRGHFTPDRHFGFEGVAWYWHFVDVVWLGLFIFVYWL
jgi:cytochrome c oxidase subunit 3